jgi:hypothetical protein
MKRIRQELDSFCHQFDISTKKSSSSGNCSKPKNYSSQKPPYKQSTHKYRKQFYSKPKHTYYKKPYKKFTKPQKPFQSKPKPKFDLKTLHVTNVTRKDIHLISAKSIPNYMSSK